MRKIKIMLTLLWAYALSVSAQNVTYLDLHDDDAINSKTVNTDLPVGFTAGALNVSPTGGASYTIPIALPPGTKGVVPSLSIGYNSQGGNGIMGMGWNIAGLSAITRTGKNMHYDGQVTPVQLNSNDFYTLDGNRLLLTYANVYSTKMETFSKISRFGSNTDSPDWFQVETKSGITYEYGNTPDSKFKSDDGTVTLFWQVNKMSDQYGNYVNYIYEMNGREIRIKEIKYTGNAEIEPYNSIKFNYANKEDNTILYVAGSSIEQKSLLTSIVISTENNQLVKAYNFSYAKDYSYSYLREVSETGSDGTSLNSTAFKYGNSIPLSADLSEESITQNMAEGATDYFSGDLNGDGYADIVAAPYLIQDGIKLHKKLKVFLNNKVNNTFNLSYSENLPEQTYISSNATSDSKGFILSDFNGDGRDDIVILAIQSSSALWLTNVNLNVKIYCTNDNATNFDKTVVYNERIGNILPNNSVVPRNIVTQGDFDGDGRTDLLISNGGYMYIDVNIPPSLILIRPFLPSALSKITIDYSQVTTPTLSELINAESLIPMDYDGDGKMEIFVRRDPFYQVIRFNQNGSQIKAEQLLTSGPVTVFPKTVFIGDFNGDRKTDFLTKASDDSWYVYYSNGANRFEITPFSFNPLPGGVFNTTPNKVMVGDFDGDGLSDVCDVSVNKVKKPDFEWEYTPKIGMYYSRGVGKLPNFLIYTRTTPCESILEPIVGDFDGDGKPDLLTSASKLYKFSTNLNAKYRLLHKVKNGFEQTAQIEYKPLTDGSSFYTKNITSTYPLNVLNSPIYVTTSAITPDGIGGNVQMSYKYENLRVHRAGLGLLGFSKFTADNALNDVRSITEFKILTPQYLSVIEKQKTIGLFNSNSISETVNTNSVQVNGVLYWVKLDKTERFNGVNGVTISADYIYDIYGNVTSETATTKTANNSNEETITSTKVFGSAYGTTVPAHPIIVGVEKTRSGNSGSVQQSSILTYNSKGDVLEKKDRTYESGSLTEIGKTNYTYNSATGLVTSSTLSSTGLPSKTVSYEYDARNRFVTATINPLLQRTEKTYDGRWGTVVTDKDITGKITTYFYDEFGRVVSTVTPQGHNITKTYAWSYNAESLPLRCYDVITTTPGKPQTWDIYDASGRLVVATHESYGDANHRWVYTYSATEYDAKGNIARKSTPVNGNNWGDEVEFTSFSYDYLNRLTSETNAIGTTTYAHTNSVNEGQSTTTVTTPAPALQVSSKTTDATGKVVSTTDHGGTLTFDYDNRGNQTSVKMNGTVITSMTYDTKGQQKTLTDQNSGTTQYTYNNYGQLTWQKDARNSEYTMNYDVLGRLTTRTGPEGTTTNEYVTSGNGLNAIKKITSFNGILQEYTYDNWHRIETATETIEGTAFTKTFTYNAYNDLLSTTYPSGLVTTNSYSGDGYLFKVTANNGTLFDGTNGEINGLGKWRNYKLGNSVTSNITYNNFGMPTRYEASSVWAGPKQDLVLNWNLQTGNLNSRVDNLKVRTENFTYDNLNRLRTGTVNGLTSYSFDFGDNGNTTFKSDAGSYTYGGTKPNAVSDVYWNVFYGNTIPSATQDVKYTKFQRPEKITEGIYEMTFMYASDYERRKTELKQNNNVINTRYFMGDYEIDVKGATTRYIHYISGGDGLCAIVVQDAQSGDFQYFFPYTDHLGSILTVTDEEGTTVAEQNFDAWGRKRNATTWDYANVGTVPDWLYRGFTGHEHLPEFGLVNMNARLYDPVLGRMLSVDNYVGAGTQGFNRYSYARNNPLNTIDPDGNNPIPFAYYNGSGGWIGGSFDPGTGLGSAQYSFSGGGTYGTFSTVGTIQLNSSSISMSQTASWKTYEYTSETERTITNTTWSTGASINVNKAEYGLMPNITYSFDPIAIYSSGWKEYYDYLAPLSKRAPNTIGERISKGGEKDWMLKGELLYKHSSSLEGNQDNHKYFGLTSKLEQYGRSILSGGFDNIDLNELKPLADNGATFLSHAAFWVGKLGDVAKSLPWVGTAAKFLDYASYVAPFIKTNLGTRLDYRFNQSDWLVKPVPEFRYMRQ